MKEPKLLISQDFLKLISEIDEFKGKWEAFKNLPPDRLKFLKKTATIESIGSSTRIEGSKLSDIQVETLLSNLKIQSFKDRDEQEVAGYAEAMDLVFLSSDDLNISENHIRQLHQLLLRHSSKDERHRGDYKKLPNHVVAIDEHGKEIGIIFETATPFETPREMEELVKWYNKAVLEESYHPLLILAIFIVTFLAIHPFQDGNGRLSRILTTLILIKFKYDYVIYSSLESIIEENKDLYYKALRRTQSSLKTEASDWDPWISFFLRSLKKQKDNLLVKVSSNDNTEKLDLKNLPILSQKILELLNEHERLTISDLATIANANKNTLKVRLRELVESKLITRYGKARAVWYSLKK